MRRQNSLRYLSPAARKELRKVVSEYETRLLDEILKNSPQFGNRKISAGDLRRIASGDTWPKNRSGVYFALDAYRILGFFVLVFAIASFFAETYQIRLTFEQQMYVVLAVFGLGLIFSRNAYDKFGKYLRRKRAGDLDFSLQFLYEWRKIESMIQQFGATKKNSRKPFSVLLGEMVEKKVISPGEYEILRGLLRARNQIVHEGNIYSNNSIRSYIAKARSIREQLEKNIAS